MAEQTKKFRLLLLLSAIPLLYACEYEPHKIYERVVDENVSPPEIQAVELNLDYDTIYLYAQKEIHFSFLSDNQKILAVRFTIDGTEQYLVNSNSGTFTLDYRMFNNGLHSLVLEVYTASGSGSIAEHLGAEGFLFSKSWVIVIDRDHSSGMRSDVSNGYLTLSWNRYHGYDIKEYTLYRWTQWNIRNEIARTNSCSFTDSTYVGEGTRYEVEVSTNKGGSLSWCMLELANELPKLTFFVSETNDNIIAWNKSKYYSAVDTFKLATSSGYSGIYTEVKSTRNPDDTTYITTALFGDNISLKLKLVPRNNILYSPSNYPRFESSLNTLLGFSFKPGVANYYHITQVSKDEFVYILNCDSLVRYSVSEKRVVERLGYKTNGCSMCNFVSFDVSASGKYLTTHVDCTQDVMLTNSGNLGNKIIRNLDYLSEQNQFTRIPASDVSTIILNKGNEGFYIYNFTGSSSLGFYKNKTGDGQGLAISMNGDYIFLKDDSLRLVYFDNTGFRNIWSQSRYNELKFCGFDGVNSDRFVIWDGSMFSFKHCSDFSTIYEFSLTDNLILSIDYHNQEMLTYVIGHLYVRSLTDGTLVKDIPTHLDPTNWFYSCILVNHAVICLAGIIYFIK